ncbi:MAG: sugar ABC transporter substrate-binding protein [Meiothermus sp.]|uniref:ABC transporter substrate-binding protein n=1 Tax=Meiothermus sp. TaxID=1955249 RepID=UPI0025DA2342|nr:sugar ABC transporter substrate-binding protein [Meiothermus sp.]MCS7068376.1 sugar ABC transporter substrate-binding protein [Meiothermus sp.]MCX7602171.1 sugar ABC transporter substrate-binding protein [Meiothermus sp.]MDW8424827.1 sugar ABC transporter substrate-binding protein [Meiothermus sp.]
MFKRWITAAALALGLSALAQTQIEFWTYYLSPNFDNYIKSTIADFERQNPTIKVRWVDKQDTMERDLTAAVALGKAPDVVNLWQDSTFAAAQNKILTPLTQLVNRNVLNQLYYPNVLDMFVMDGQVYGLPWYGWLDQGVMMYNPDLLQKAGVDARTIRNTDDLLAASEKIKKATGAYGWLPPVKDPNGASFLGRFFLEGLPVYDKDGKAAFNSPAHVALLQKYVDAMKNDIIPQELLRKEAFQLSNELYSQGKAAIVVGAPTTLNRVKEANPDLYAKTRIGPAPLGKAGIQTGGAMSLVIPSASKNKSAAIRFALFVTNRTNQVKFANVVPIVSTAAGSENDPGLKAKSNDPLEIGKGMNSASGRLINPGFKPPKNTDDIYKNFNDNIEAAFLGRKTPKQALDDAVAFWNANAR